MITKCSRLFLLVIMCSINFSVVGVVPLNKITKYVSKLNTIPKCGTNLAKKALWLMIGTTEMVMEHSHFWPEQEIIQEFSKPNTRVIFMMRDPRDMLISYAKWIVSRNYPIGYGKTFDDMFEYILVNGVMEEMQSRGPDFLTVGPLTLYERYKQYFEGWKICPTLLIIRFEDLVGKQGGGSAEVQKQMLIKIGKHLEIELSNEDILFIQENIFGASSTFTSPTFREGQIGGWKKHFTPERKTLFKKYFPTEYLIELGYETSYEW